MRIKLERKKGMFVCMYVGRRMSMHVCVAAATLGAVLQVPSALLIEMKSLTVLELTK